MFSVSGLQQRYLFQGAENQRASSKENEDRMFLKSKLLGTIPWEYEICSRIKLKASMLKLLFSKVATALVPSWI
jgi:hypothetical protein